MIPTIGTIVAAYAAFRIFEILAQGKTRHASDGKRFAVLIFGILALLVMGIGLADLILSGTSASPR
jgi:hypothetical protein